MAGSGHSLFAGRAGAVGGIDVVAGVCVGAVESAEESGARSDEASDAGEDSDELHALKAMTSAVAMAISELRMQPAL